jgi:molybdate transport system substrate-binding protein
MTMIARILLAALLGSLASVAAAEQQGVTVFAAASLTNVLQEVGKAFTAETKIPVTFSFAASSGLARQIESGAPADVFVSADQEWMNYLQARKLIAVDTRVDVASNDLVLIAPADSTAKIRIAPGFALAGALGEGGRLAMGDPASVPAGKYAQVALTHLGVWASVAQRIAAADNVRTALVFVARGEAPVGIVYSTDAKLEPEVRVVDVFPASTHEPITYPAALTAQGSAQGAAFLRYLSGSRAREIFARAGFGRP